MPQIAFNQTAVVSQTAAGSLTASAAPADANQQIYVTGFTLFASAAGTVAFNDGSADKLKINVIAGPNIVNPDTGFSLPMGATKPLIVVSATGFVNGTVNFKVL